MHAADVRGDVDVDDVALAQRPVVADAVAHDLVHRRADRLREVLVVQRARVGAAFEIGVVGDLVEVVGGDARADGGADRVAHLGGHAAGVLQAGELVGVVDDLHRRTIGSGVAVAHVPGALDVVGNRARGSDPSGSQRFERCLELAVALLELPLRPAPAHVVASPSDHASTLGRPFAGSTPSRRCPHPSTNGRSEEEPLIRVAAATRVACGTRTDVWDSDRRVGLGRRLSGWEGMRGRGCACAPRWRGDSRRSGGPWRG